MKKGVLFFTLWLLVGLLGFIFGMKLSTMSDAKQEYNQVSRKKTTINGATNKTDQASKVTLTAENDSWEQTLQMDILVVEKTIQMLKEEYIDNVNSKKLINGSIKGMKLYLISKRLKADYLKPIPVDMPQKEAINELKKTYSKTLALYGAKIKESDLAYAALKGTMDSLKDPYSVALLPKEYKLLDEQMSGGNYGGIGVYLERSKRNNNQLTIVEPIDGSPAKRAGIKPGDAIMKINGESMKGIDLELAAQKIRGEVDSTVTLTIFRKHYKLKNYSMKRAIIHVSSVDYSMKPGNIGFIKMRFFGNETDVEFSRALDKVKSLGAKGIIIDLRNNGGGYISAAIDVCSKMLLNGTLIVSVVNQRTGRNEIHKAQGSDQIKLPIVVLINDLSASAAEITAGALKDTKTAVLIGEKSFGKGCVQTIHELRDGGALKYTIAKYLTPKGIDIDKKGIAPDIVIKMGPDKVGTGKDKQLRAALLYLQKKLEKKATP